MQYDHKPSLSVFPNKRGFGYACLADPQEPIDYGTVTVRPLSRQKILSRYTHLLDYLQPELIILRDGRRDNMCHSGRIKNIVAAMENECHSRDCHCFQYTRAQIRMVFSQFGARSRYEIAQLLVQWFPELESRAPKRRKLWMPEDYYIGIFDAFSLTVTHYYLNQ